MNKEVEKKIGALTILAGIAGFMFTPFAAKLTTLISSENVIPAVGVEVGLVAIGLTALIHSVRKPQPKIRR